MAILSVLSRGFQYSWVRPDGNEPRCQIDWDGQVFDGDPRARDTDMEDVLEEKYSGNRGVLL